MNRQPLGHRKADEIARLSDDNEDANARGEANDHRMRYEIDERAQPQKAEGKLHEPNHEGKGYGKFHIKGRARFGKRWKRRGEHERRRGAGPGDQMP